MNTEHVVTQANYLTPVVESTSDRVILRDAAKDAFLRTAREMPLPNDIQISGYRTRLNLVGAAGWAFGREWYWEPINAAYPQRTGDEPV